MVKEIHEVKMETCRNESGLLSVKRTHIFNASAEFVRDYSVNLTHIKDVDPNIPILDKVEDVSKNISLWHWGTVGNFIISPRFFSIAQEMTISKKGYCIQI
jgi:hypothetical protein